MKVVIEINVTKEDFFTFSRYACSLLSSAKSTNNKSFIINFVFWIVFILGLFWAFNDFNLQFPPFHWPTAILTSTPFILYSLYFINNMQNIEQRAVSKEDGIIVGKHTLEFNSEGILDTCEFGHSFYKWIAVQDIISNKGNIYIFYDKLLGQIIPKSSFKNESEHNELMHNLKQMHKAKNTENNLNTLD